MAGQALRIVLIGTTGAGKSSAGNTLLGRIEFKSGPSMHGVTKTCEKVSAVNAGRYIEVTDTPGILDPDRDPEEVKQEILNCMSVSCPGPHAFLLVVRIGRHNKPEWNAVKGLQEIFEGRAKHHMIVLFTRGDELEREGMTIHQYLDESPPLQALVNSCGGRFHVFNNMSDDVRQVYGLISEVDEVVALNGGNYFSEAMYQEVDQVVRHRGVYVVEFFRFTFLPNLMLRVIRFQKILEM